MTEKSSTSSDCMIIPFPWALEKKLLLSFMWIKDAISQLTCFTIEYAKCINVMCVADIVLVNKVPMLG